MTTVVNSRATNGAGGTLAAYPGGGSASSGGAATVIISGTPAVGSVLTAVTFGVTPTTWQWYQDGVIIGGATASTYTVQSGDASHTLTVKVNGTILSAGVSIPGAQTFRSIGALGANITWVNSSLGNRIFTNAFYNGARMQKTGQPFVNCTRDATTGWPTEAFYVTLSASSSNGTTFFDGAVPPGTYTWSYSYDNTIFATAISTSTGGNTPVSIGVTGFSTGTPVVVGSITTVPFTFTFATLGTLTLSFTGPVTFVDCPFDGQATCVGQPLCRNEALASYSQYGVLRTLDFLSGGSRTDVLWSDRPPNYTGPQLAQDIPSWERCIDVMLAIKNYPGSRLKTWMVNLPAYSDPSSYATPLATLMNTKSVPANFLHMEYGNEPFNFGAGAASVRFHGWENAAMNTAGGIANYELTTGAGTPTALYQSQGQIVTGMSLDSTGNVTVSLNVNCSTVLDLNSNPMIVALAPLIVSSTFTPSLNAGGLAADISRTCTIISVGTTSFVYNTGVAVTTPVSIGAGSGAATQLYFKTTSPLLVDNLSYAIGNMQKKWWMNQLQAFQTAWVAVRSKATYHDKWYINISPIGGLLPPGGNKTRSFEFTYGAYLGSGTMSSWVDEVAPATYTAPIGTVAAEADMFNPAMSTSLYHVLNDATFGQQVDNQCRGLVYQCLVLGMAPITYEGGPALQTASSSNFVVASAADLLMETYLTTHQQVVLNNGVFWYTHYMSSPRIFQNGSTGNSSWQSMQFFNDSVTSGDPTYSAKKAALEKFNDPVLYTNINGSDLTTLDVGQYQNATVLTGNDNFTTGVNATTGAFYWGTGGTALNRNMDWVYCNNTFTSRQIFVDGTDSQATAVQVWVYPPDLSGPIQLGTVHLPVNGVTNAGTPSTVGPCPDPITWTPTLAGPHVFRLILTAGSGTGPGLRRVRFV